MSLTINTNLASLNAQRNLTASQSSLQTSMQRLSSGLRINSANASNTSADRDSLNQEYQQLGAEILRVAGGTTFNGLHILGADAKTLTFPIGANTSSDDTIDITTSNMVTNADITAVTGAKIDGATVTKASDAKPTIDAIDTAINTVNSERATMGASQSRFTAVISNLQVSVENQTAAKSRIMDADFASETANMSRANILQQAGTAMIAQANQLPQQVLTLLRG